MLLLEVKNDTEVGKIHAADKFFREFERGLLMCLFTIDCLCDSDRMRGVKRVLIECLTVVASCCAHRKKILILPAQEFSPSF